MVLNPRRRRPFCVLRRHKGGGGGRDRTTQSVAAVRIFGVLITNIMLVLITDDVFMHLGQVESGHRRSTVRSPAGYS